MSAMLCWPEAEGVQSNGCLALMAMVRGEGDTCQASQWNIAKVRGRHLQGGLVEHRQGEGQGRGVEGHACQVR